MDMKSQIAKMREMKNTARSNLISSPIRRPTGMATAQSTLVERRKELDDKLNAKKERYNKENPHTDRKTIVDFDVDSLFAKVLESISASKSLPADFDLSIIDIRLETCRTCDGLHADGCAYCPSCQNHWIGLQNHLINGDCVRFGHVASNFAVPQPLMKVNEMFVYNYSISYTLPDAPAKRLALAGVIAESLESATAAVKKILPTALVIDARAIHPINVIANSVAVGDIEIVLEPQQMDRQPQGMPMMAGPQGMPMMRPPGMMGQ